MESSSSQGRPQATERRARKNPWTGFLATSGLIAIAGGLALALGPRYSSELAWIAQSFHKLGIDSGVVLSGGLLCGLLAVLSRQVQGVGAQMRTAEEAMHCTQALSLGMRQMVDRFTRLHVELGELKEGQRSLYRLQQELSNKEVSGQQLDATYRLAASMDQLGRRFEDRMHSMENTFDSRFLDLLGSIAATQEQLRDMLEENSVSRDTDDLLDGPRLGMPSRLDVEPTFARNEEDEVELEVCVELDAEDAVVLDGELEACDVTKFDWNQVKIPDHIQQIGHEDGLGILDEIDVDGADFDDKAIGRKKFPVDEMPSLLGMSSSDPTAKLFTEKALEEAWQAFKRKKE